MHDVTGEADAVPIHGGFRLQMSGELILRFSGDESMGGYPPPDFKEHFPGYTDFT